MFVNRNLSTFEYAMEGSGFHSQATCVVVENEWDVTGILREGDSIKDEASRVWATADCTLRFSHVSVDTAH
jgi:hypothetical protein